RNMAGNLKFGLTSVHAGANSYPEKMAHIAQVVESAGFDSVWAGGHPVLSETQSRIPPTLRMPDPVVALTFIAAHTRTIRLGTGIILLPQHNPLILAKQLASLDVLSGGRLIFGIGVGWSEHEYSALGISYHDRGARADEYLKAMQIIWSEDKPAYHGRFVSFEGVQAYPRPVALGELEISVAPRVPIDRTTAQQFAELGVHRLILIPPPNTDTPALEHLIDTVGNTLIGQV